MTTMPELYRRLLRLEQVQREVRPPFRIRIDRGDGSLPKSDAPDGWTFTLQFDRMPRPDDEV